MQRLVLVRLDVVGRDRAARARHFALVRRQRAIHPARPEMPRGGGAVHHQDRLLHPARAQIAGHPCHESLQCVVLAATSRCSVWPGSVAIASSAASARKLIQRAILSLVLAWGLVVPSFMMLFPLALNSLTITLPIETDVSLATARRSADRFGRHCDGRLGSPN